MTGRRLPDEEVGQRTLYMRRYRERIRATRPQKVKADRRNWQLQTLYGITRAEYDRMADAQEHKCAICAREDWASSHGKLQVDHDHTTGAIRGLLCSQCNTLLGLSGDSSENLKRAAAYLDRRM